MLGKCGSRFGVEGSMHWLSRMRICKERKGRGMSCDSGSEPCSMGLLLAQAPAQAPPLPFFNFFKQKSILKQKFVKMHVKHCMTPYCIYSTQPGVVFLHVACELLLHPLKEHVLTPLRQFVQCFCSSGFVFDFFFDFLFFWVIVVLCIFFFFEKFSL